MLSVPIDVATSGDNVIVAAVPNRTIRVMGWVIQPDAVVVCRFKSSGGTALTGPMKITQGLVAPMGPLAPGGWQGQFDAAQGEGLVLNLGTAVQASGYVNYVLV